MRQIKISPNIISEVKFSDDLKYRYFLKRRWSNGPVVLWIMLNPSTADEKFNDPTVKRCEVFSKTWGFSGYSVANLYAYRSTDPRQLKIVEDPTGSENDQNILELVSQSDLVIAAWGTHGINREQEVIKKVSCLKDIYCIGITKNGHPKHPLYVSSATEKILFKKMV